MDDRVPPGVPDLQVIAALSSLTMPSLHMSRSDASLSGDRGSPEPVQAEVIEAEMQQESETATGFAETGQRAPVARSTAGIAGEGTPTELRDQQVRSNGDCRCAR